MTTSRVPDVIDVIVAALTAAAIPGTQVYDGPVITSGSEKSVVFVGYDGDPDDTNPGATSNQEQWEGLGAHRKAEMVEVSGAVVCWSGDTDIRAARQAAYAVMAAVETALRPADLSFGLPSPTVFTLATGQLFQEQTEVGATARVTFTVHVQTRI